MLAEHCILCTVFRVGVKRVLVSGVGAVEEQYCLLLVGICTGFDPVAVIQSVCLVLEPLLLEGLVPGLAYHEFVDKLIPLYFVLRPIVVV